MTAGQRVRLVARLLAGVIPVRPGGRVYLLREISPEARFLIEEEYASALAEAEAEGLLTESEAIDLARSEGRWDDAKQKQLQQAEKDIDDLKVSLFEGWFRPAEQQQAFSRLARCREVIGELAAAKQHHFGRTALHVAASHKARATIAYSLSANGNRVFGDDPSSWSDASLIDEVIELAAKERLGEAELREIARTAPWQSYWSIGTPNPFGGAATHLGDDRLTLCNFSIMYDRIRESPDRPAQEILECDDATDGWLIVQKRKASLGDEDRVKQKMIGSEKIGSCKEVFVMVKSDQEAARVNEWNGYEAKKAIAQRKKMIAEKGSVVDLEFHDVKEEISTRLAEMEFAAHKK